MLDSVYISICQIHFEGGTTDSCDDTLSRESSLEVRIPEEEAYDRIPDFPTFHIIRYLYILIVATDLHLPYDDAGILTEPGDTLIWPGYTSRTSPSSLYDIIGLYDVFLCFTEYDGSILSDDLPTPLFHEKYWIDGIIRVECCVVAVRTHTEDDEQDARHST
jgi:hypothetical protein